MHLCEVVNRDRQYLCGHTWETVFPTALCGFSISLEATILLISCHLFTVEVFHMEGLGKLVYSYVRLYFRFTPHLLDLIGTLEFISNPISFFFIFSLTIWTFFTFD